MPANMHERTWREWLDCRQKPGRTGSCSKVAPGLVQSVMRMLFVSCTLVHGSQVNIKELPVSFEAEDELSTRALLALEGGDGGGNIIGGEGGGGGEGDGRCGGGGGKGGGGTGGGGGEGDGR